MVTFGMTVLPVRLAPVSSSFQLAEEHGFDWRGGRLCREGNRGQKGAVRVGDAHQVLEAPARRSSRVPTPPEPRTSSGPLLITRRR